MPPHLSLNSLGLSLYQTNQKADHKSPTMERMTNADRHPQSAMIATTITGVRPPATRAQACVIPPANPRSVVGSQWEKARVALGKAPASLMPKKPRTTTIETKFQAKAVTPVKNDHSSTSMDKILRGPYLSPSMPTGS